MTATREIEDSMPVSLVGTRVDEAPTTTVDASRLIEVSRGGSIAVVSAYWDKSAIPVAIDLALRVGGTVRVALWAGGATDRSAVDALVEHGTGDSRIEVRIIGSPAAAGIFHAKVTGVVHDSGEWHCAIVGSANFTRAAREENVELGVILHDEPRALDQIASWFEGVWESGTGIEDFADLDELRDISTRASHELAQARGVRGLIDVHPVHAGDIKRTQLALRERRRNAPARLSVCHGNERQIGKFLDVLIAKVAGDRDEQRTSHEGQRKIAGETVRRIRLMPENGSIHLRFWPGDVLEQARPLFRSASRVSQLLGLRQRGWEILPNFHWGYIETGKVRINDMPGTLSVDEYCDYWATNVPDAGRARLAPAEFDPYLDRLVADRVIDDRHRAEFDRVFVRGGSPLDHAVPWPGLACSVTWSLDEAIALEDRGELVANVKGRANELLDALAEPLV